jgi:hypothetical protein
LNVTSSVVASRRGKKQRRTRARFVCSRPSEPRTRCLREMILNYMAEHSLGLPRSY